MREQLQDDLLDKLIGRWLIAREFAGRQAKNTASIEWVLEHQFVRICMVDTADPPGYEAHVYIGYDPSNSHYVAHWIDVFGGQYSSLGFGVRDGDSIRIEFGGDLVNTFTYHADSDSWTSKIDQTNKNGEWVNFCTDTYTRK